MGKVVKKVADVGKNVVKKVADVGGNVAKQAIGPVLGGAAGFALGGPVGAGIGAGVGQFVGGGGASGLLGNLGGDTRDVVTSSTALTPIGQRQFDFGQSQLLEALQGPIRVPQADFSAAQNALRSIDFGSINRDVGALRGFSGTQAAKNALNRVGAFKGTPEAFRTLRALEDFGRREQSFVTRAREALLSFDAGFQSRVLPLLQQAAEGRFLTEEAGNPFIRDLIDTAQRPVIENFREQVLPDILSTFAGTGGVGSSLRGAVTAQQARDLQRNLGDISSTIGFNVFESERVKQLAAQQAILGFESQSLDRRLTARTINLQAAQTTAAQLLAARQAAGAQATQLSAQRLAALQSAAQGQVQLSAQRQASLAAALQGSLGAGQLRASQAGTLANIAGQRQQVNLANAQLQRDRVNQLLDLQRNAGVAGQQNIQRFIKPGL